MTADSNKTSHDFSDLTFEDSLAKLDETVRELEAGALSLNDATQMFEEGMSLARHCGELLAAAELRITRIRTAYGEQAQMREPGSDYDPASPE